MAIITLTSDWGWKDYYAGAVKGAILSKAPTAQIVDISHDVRPFSMEEAAFILKNSYKNFPDGSIHLVCVNSEEEEERIPHLVIYCNKHYFIGADTGIFSMILDRDPDQIISMQVFNKPFNNSFPERDCFAKAAAHIAMGNPIETLGTNVDSINQKLVTQPVVTDDLIRGEVIYIDNYENLITNISVELFERMRRGRDVYISYNREVIEDISFSYHDKADGELLAIFGAHGNLELAINKGNAKGLLGGDIYEKVLIEFKRPNKPLRPLNQ